MPNPILHTPENETVVALDIVPITPNDSVALATPVRAIRCNNNGTSGAIVIVTYLGAERTTDIAAGETLSVYVSQVKATGTTATGLEGLV